jgi:hypothetical protein
VTVARYDAIAALIKTTLVIEPDLTRLADAGEPSAASTGAGQQVSPSRAPPPLRRSPGWAIVTVQASR